MSNHICSSPFADNEEMKEHHPHFQFHTHDWLICHLLVKHCQARAQWFAKVGNDPYLKIYKNYMNNQKQERQKKAQQTLKKHYVEPPKHLALPGPKVSICSLFHKDEDMSHELTNVGGLDT